MPAISSFLAATAIIGIGVSTFIKSKSIKAEGDYRQQVYNTNAKFANLQAEDAIRRGDENSDIHLKKVRTLIGRQRAILAAQNIEIDSGSALSIQEETAEIGALDALKIRNNAWRESWGYKVQVSEFESKARFVGLETKNRASNTILTGGLQALNTGLNLGYYRLSQQIGDPSTTSTTPSSSTLRTQTV